MLVILTIILSLIGVQLTRDRGDIVRDEARRLALVLRSAQQQAILEGRPYGFMVTGEGYRFLRLDDQSRLVPIDADELLRARALPPAVHLGPLEAARNVARGADAPRADLILFDPSGEFSAFTLVLKSADIVWYVEGRNDGQILSSPFLEPAAA